MGNNLVRSAECQATSNPTSVTQKQMSSSQPKSPAAGGDAPADRTTDASPTSPQAMPTDSTSSKFPNNPGSYEEIHKKCKDVFPICFDGAKAMIQKGLSNHFQITHTLSLQPQNAGWRFGATYVGTKQISPTEVYPVFLGDSDLSGNTSATLLHQFGDRFRCKVQSQIQQNKFAAFQGTGEYRGRLSTLGLTFANPDLVNESGIVVAQYLRRIVPRLDLGLEMVYQYGKQIPGAQFSTVQYALRYNGDKCVFSGTGGRTGLHLCYYHKQQENLQFGVEWETNFRLKDSVATLAYQLEVPKANLLVRASADTQWTVGAVVEKRLQPLPFTLALSGMINHEKAQSRFGIGLILG